MKGNKMLIAVKPDYAFQADTKSALMKQIEESGHNSGDFMILYAYKNPGGRTDAQHERAKERSRILSSKKYVKTGKKPGRPKGR